MIQDQIKGFRHFSTLLIFRHFSTLVNFCHNSYIFLNLLYNFQ